MLDLNVAKKGGKISNIVALLSGKRKGAKKTSFL